jgi:hypothetical protein
LQALLNWPPLFVLGFVRPLVSACTAEVHKSDRQQKMEGGEGKAIQLHVFNLQNTSLFPMHAHTQPEDVIVNMELASFMLYHSPSSITNSAMEMCF